MIVRMFLSKCAPEDLPTLTELFREDIAPAFAAYEQCLGIEMIVSAETGADGLLEGGAITRWTDIEAMEEILAKPDIQDAQVRIREYLRRTPIRKTFEVAS